MEAWRLFFALGDPHRLEIVSRLAASGPLAMGRVLAGFPFSRQAGAKHVAVLSDAGLVVVSKQGRERVVELVPDNLRLSQMFMAQLGSDWDDRLEGLRALLED